MRPMEKRRELVRQADVDALIDDIAGVTLALACRKTRCEPSIVSSMHETQRFP
jgi:hypothetical protein